MTQRVVNQGVSATAIAGAPHLRGIAKTRKLDLSAAFSNDQIQPWTDYVSVLLGDGTGNLSSIGADFRYSGVDFGSSLSSLAVGNFNGDDGVYFFVARHCSPFRILCKQPERPVISPTSAPIGPSTGPSQRLRRIHCCVVVAGFRKATERICLGRAGRVLLRSQMSQLCVSPSSRVSSVWAVLRGGRVEDEDVLIVWIELHGEMAANERGEPFGFSLIG